MSAEFRADYFFGDGTGLSNVTATLPSGVVTNPAGGNRNGNSKDSTNWNLLATANLQITGNPTAG